MPDSNKYDPQAAEAKNPPPQSFAPNELPQNYNSLFSQPKRELAASPEFNTNTHDTPAADQNYSPQPSDLTHFHWPFTKPKRTRKNLIKPPCVYGTCDNLADFYEFKEWAVKEWMVYTAYVHLLREDLNYCYMQHGVNNRTKCRKLADLYIHSVSDTTLREKRKMLWRGERIVE